TCELLAVCVSLRLRWLAALFPYTTLFRSVGRGDDAAPAVPAGVEQHQLVAERHRAAVEDRLAGEAVAASPALGDQLLQVGDGARSEEHTSELQSREKLVCRLLLEKTKETD